MAYSNLLQTANLLQVLNLLEVTGLSGFNNQLQVANGVMPPFGPIPPSTSGFELEDGSGVILLESGDILLLEIQ